MGQKLRKQAPIQAVLDTLAVLWFVGNTSMNASDVYTKENNSTWNTRAISTLRLIMKRKLNNKQVKCVWGNDISKLSEHNLNVICKYGLLYI